MLEILQFMFHGFWISIASLILAGMGLILIDQIIHIAANTYSRTWRYICILVRGYPKTPNMDADGDIVLPK